MKLKIVGYLILFFSLSGFWQMSYAHEVRPAYLQIKQVSDNVYQVLWKVPRIGDQIPEIEPQFPQNFELNSTALERPISGSMLFIYKLEGPAPLAGNAIRIHNLNKTMLDVLVNVAYLDGEEATLLLKPDRIEGILPGKTNTWSVIRTYTGLGIEHILFGIDHLLFVLSLIIITKGFRKVVKTITAFTLAHSITLSLAVLGFANVPGPPVEAVIALSIVFLALEIVRNIQGHETLTSRKPWLVAFSFGLLHGFGFAGALVEVGLPQTDIPIALAFFNVGVEIGQLCFVVCVIGLIKVLSLYKKWPKVVQKIPPYAIGSMATFWVIERIAAFWG